MRNLYRVKREVIEETLLDADSREEAINIADTLWRGEWEPLDYTITDAEVVEDEEG